MPPAINVSRLRPDASLNVARLSGDAMGTSWSVLAALSPRHNVDDLRESIESGFDRIIAQMSQWDTHSQISRFNAAPAGSWFEIAPQFSLVMKTALQIRDASGGAFDPAIGHASEAWGFGAKGRRELAPDADEIATMRDAGRADFQYDEMSHRIYQPGGVMLDLSGIAKGFAVDYTVALLEARGVQHMLVEIGGELRGVGVRPDGLPWWVDVESAPANRIAPARIALSNWAVATTGHYLRRSGLGEGWSHSIDPKSAMPVAADIQSVTVMHPQCMQADALATAITVMGVEKGMEFAEKHRLALRICVGADLIRSKIWQSYCE